MAKQYKKGDITKTLTELDEKGKAMKLLWSEEKQLVYAEAVKNVDGYLDMKAAAGHDFSAFDGSTMLAVCFDVDKEITLNDLTALRMGKLIARRTGEQ